MAESDKPLKTYRGNCHCGAFVYEAQLPEIKSAGDCNCTICVKKGYLLVFTTDENFKVIKGSEDQLSEYIFGGKMMSHKFCPHCATPVLVRSISDQMPPEYAIGLNVHAIQGLNTWELERSPYDGASLGGPYEPPAHKGGKPVEIDGGVTYNGSCHCGAVTVEVQSKPIDETYHETICECNCSVCERGAYIWAYMAPEQVVLSAASEEDIGRYQFNNKLLSKTFCKRCGVLLTNESVKLSEAEIGQLSEHQQKMHQFMRRYHPVNLRVLNNFDLSKVKPKIQKLDGRKNLPGSYEEP